MNTNSRDKIINILKWLWFVACAVVLVVYLQLKIDSVIDSDMSSELILSKHLADTEKWILSKEWYYSTEIKFLSDQLVFAPLFLVFKSWHTVRVIGTIIMLCMMLVSFYFLLKSLEIEDSFPLIGGCLLLPLSDKYFYYVVAGTFYASHLIFIFLILSFYFFAKKQDEKYKGNLIVLAVISLLAGMNGFRLILVLAAPIIIYNALRFIKELYQYEPICKKMEGIVPSPFAEKYIPGLVFSISIFIGFAFNILYIGKNYSVLSNENLQWWDFEFSMLEKVIRGLLADFGYKSLRFFLKPNGITNIIGICFLAFSVFATIDVLFFSKNKTDENQRELAGILSIGMLIIFGILTISTMEEEGAYFIPSLVLIIPVIGVYFKSNSNKKYYCGLLASVLLLCTVWVSAVNFNRYEGAATAKPNISWSHYGRKNVADFLVENGYYNGYATFWNANVLTEYSNGKIEMWALKDKLDGLSPWLQMKEHLKNKPEGKVFFLIDYFDADCQNLYGFINKNADNAIYDDGRYFVYDLDTMVSDFEWAK